MQKSCPYVSPYRRAQGPERLAYPRGEDSQVWSLGIPLQDFFEGFDRKRPVSRGRLNLELEIQRLVRGLSDKDVRSAIELVKVLAKRRSEWPRCGP